MKSIQGITGVLLACSLGLFGAATVHAQDAAGKKAKVFILMGQSNMVGLGKVKGPDGSLEFAVQNKKLYPYLVDGSGAWRSFEDVRYVRVMVGRGGGMQLFNNEPMTVEKCRTIGPEFGIGHMLGGAIDQPVVILKSCIGNRSLGWDLLPPGSERYVVGDKVYAAYKEKPDAWPVDPAKGVETDPPAEWLDKKGKPIQWYAGKQYDDDVANAKAVLADPAKYMPGCDGFEVAGFFFWQGEKDCGNAAHAARYEQNLVTFIKQLRVDFNCPGAPFVLGTLGESEKGKATGNGALVLEAQLAVDGTTGKYPEFKGNVATVYTHPISKGGSGNSHYNGNAETYMEVGEAMGKAMAGLLGAGK